MSARRAGLAGAVELTKVANMNWWKVSLPAAVVLLAGSSAMGASVESKERAAKKACLLGDVDKGAEILADIYVSTNDPTYIYNQGRCFEQNGMNDRAVLRFKEYLRKAKGLSRADSDAVLKKIDELQSAAGQHRAQPAPTPAPQPSAAPAAQPSAVPAPQLSVMPATAAPPEAVATAPDPLGVSQSAPPPEPQASPPVYKRWWFWTGVGALVAGGVVTGVLVLSRKSAPTRSTCDEGVKCAP